MADNNPAAEIDNFLATAGRAILGFLIAVCLLACIRVLSIIIQLPGFIVDSLVHTGRGIGLYKLRVFIPINIGLLWVSIKLQSVAGDWIFLLWAVFSIKWVAEWIWAIVRRSVLAGEHSMHPGVLLTSVIGINNLYVAFSLVAICGVVLMSIPTGWAIGGLLTYGSMLAIVVYSITSLLGIEKSLQEVDQAFVARSVAQSDGDSGVQKTFGRVRIK